MCVRKGRSTPCWRACSCASRMVKPTPTSLLRHAFITRSILAGIPPAVVLKASGHSSDEWKRYLNVTPDMLRDLLTPLAGQESESVKAHGVEVMRQLTAALMGSWKSVGNSEFFQDLWAKVAMPNDHRPNNPASALTTACASISSYDTYS